MTAIARHREPIAAPAAVIAHPSLWPGGMGVDSTAMIIALVARGEAPDLGPPPILAAGQR